MGNGVQQTTTDTAGSAAWGGPAQVGAGGPAQVPPGGPAPVPASDGSEQVVPGVAAPDSTNGHAPVAPNATTPVADSGTLTIGGGNIAVSDVAPGGGGVTMVDPARPTVGTAASAANGPAIGAQPTAATTTPAPGTAPNIDTTGGGGGALTAPITMVEHPSTSSVAGVSGGGPASTHLVGGPDSATALTGIVPTAGTPVGVTGGGPGANVAVIGGPGTNGGMDLAATTGSPLSPAERQLFGMDVGTNAAATTAGGPDSDGCGMAGCSGGAGCSHHGDKAAPAAAANGGAAAAAAPTSHSVKKGDTLASIAKLYGVTAKALKTANPKLGSGAPIPGTKLKLPAGAKAPVKSAAKGGPASLGSLDKYPKTGSTEAQRIEFIHWAAAQYGVSATVLHEIAKRESGLRPDAVNDYDSNAKKGTPSKGIMQFIEPTFKSFAPLAQKANPKAWEGMGTPTWLDWRHQVLTAAWGIANGKGSHWATYEAAKRAAG